MANPFPLLQEPPTTLPYQRFLDNELVPVIQTHKRGIAFLEASYLKVDNHGEVVIVSIGGLLVSQEVRVLAIDSGTDLALLEMPNLPEGFPPLHTFPLAADGVQTGEHLHTVGHPGLYIYSTRSGRVSFPCRSVPSPVPSRTNSPPGFHLVKVSFLTPPGFSSSPLIDTLGRVVFVNHCIELGNYNYILLFVPARYVNGLILWHFQNPGLFFMRSDGAPDYPLGFFAPSGDPPFGGGGGGGGGGFEGEGSGSGGVGAVEGVGAGEGAGEGTGEEGEVGEEAEEVLSDNFLEVSEFFLDFP
ncbi:hypothetical protein Vadar_012730 [Vaccinium darrowii]|uniref:Uncharacterized protein n=1 Tax=Vaccinium darrowii TaxID=229202 RepID=A0ACB7Y0B0_9ERIC|nr:hypothetical protein Vadar_012730 [Vaccinium darrowii]